MSQVITSRHFSSLLFTSLTIFTSLNIFISLNIFTYLTMFNVLTLSLLLLFHQVWTSQVQDRPRCGGGKRWSAPRRAGTGGVDSKQQQLQHQQRQWQHEEPGRHSHHAINSWNEEISSTKEPFSSYKLISHSRTFREAYHCQRWASLTNPTVGTKNGARQCASTNNHRIIY